MTYVCPFHSNMVQNFCKLRAWKYVVNSSYCILSCKETVLIHNLVFVLTSPCMQYPHTVPFMRNKIPYSPLETPKTHASKRP